MKHGRAWWPGRWFGVIGVLVVAAAALAACRDDARDRATIPTAVRRAVGVVSLGDSVPAGTDCECRPYPALLATDLSGPRTRITSENEAVAGYTTDDVVKQLAEPSVVQKVRAAAAVTIEIGANDVAHSTSCGNDTACYLADLPHVRANLEAIVSRVREIADGHVVAIVLLDYWSVWLGGEYAHEQGAAYVEAAEAVTTGINHTIESVATARHCTYVSLVRAFRGSRESRDETRLLASDGEHPNARGHRRIASAITATMRR